MEEKMKREIKQLWKAAYKCFSLALEEKSNVNEDNMNLTVGDLTKEDIIADLSNYDNIFFFTMHLSSSAIRLFSIDANFFKNNKNENGRYKSYVSLSSQPVSTIENEIENNLDIYMHSLLRHMTCHAEIQRLDFKNKDQYDEMYNIYLTFTIKKIYKNMNTLIDVIEEELRQRKIID